MQRPGVFVSVVPVGPPGLRAPERGCRIRERAGPSRGPYVRTRPGSRVLGSRMAAARRTC